jgi:hypothetical protein
MDHLALSRDLLTYFVPLVHFPIGLSFIGFLEKLDQKKV